MATCRGSSPIAAAASCSRAASSFLAVVASLLIIVVRGQRDGPDSRSTRSGCSCRSRSRSRAWRSTGGVRRMLGPGRRTAGAWFARCTTTRGGARRCALNGFGAVLTAVVTIIFAVDQVQRRRMGHSDRHSDPGRRRSTRSTATTRTCPASCPCEAYGPPPRVDRHRVILPISGIHRGTLERAALRARTVGGRHGRVHLDGPREDREGACRLGALGAGVRLVVVNSPYRLLAEPLLAYVRDLARRRQPNEIMTIVVPQFVPRAVVAQPAARPDRVHAAPRADVRAGDRHHERALPRRTNRRSGVTMCTR